MPGPSRGADLAGAQATEPAGWASAGTSAERSCSSVGSHSSHVGRYQFQLAEQLHRRRQQHRPDDRRVDQDGDGEADAHLLHVDDRHQSRRSRTRTTITTAALVTTPAVVRDARARRRPRCSMPAVVGLADPAEDEHVVVHREAEQDHEQEHRQPRGDAAVRLEAEQVLAPAALEDQRRARRRRRRPRAGSARSP